MSYFYTNVARRGNNILCKYIKDGERHQVKIPFKPELFMSNPTAETSTRCYKGEQKIERIEFDNMREANDFLKRYEGIHGVQMHGMEDYVLQFINRAFRTPDMEIEYDEKQVRVCWLDIEVSSYENGVDNGFPHADAALWPITCIGSCDVVGDKYHLFTTGYVDEAKLADHPRLQGLDIVVHRYDTEYSMMSSWCRWWRAEDYDMAIGFNSERFDIPYITNRCYRILGNEQTRQLSPYGIIQERTVESKFGEYQTYDWVGINLMDYLHIYQKHSFTTLRSYKLDAVADFEIGTGKLDYTEAGTLNGLWSGQFRTDWHEKSNSDMSQLAKVRTAIGDKLTMMGHPKLLCRDDELPPREHIPQPYEVKDINYDALNAKFDRLLANARREERKTYVERSRVKAIEREEYRHKMRCKIRDEQAEWDQVKIDSLALIWKLLDECGDDVELLEEQYKSLDGEILRQCQQLYHQYNIVDVRVMVDIDIKRQLIPLTIQLAYTCFCNYNDTLRTVRPWDALVYRYLILNDRQPPIVARDQTEKEKFPGAFVFEVQQGKHKWIWSADAASLYPITEISTNISAEVIVDYADLPDEVQQAIPMNHDHEEFIQGLIDEEYDLSCLKKHNLSMSGFRQFFKRDDIGIFPQIKADLFKRRKGFKGQMFVEQNKIQAIKAEAERRGLTLHS